MGANQIPREDVQMETGLPISASLRRSSSASRGCELHWHEALELYYVREGGVLLLSGGRQAWLEPGDVGFVNWCEPHRGSRFLDGTAHWIVQISAAFLAQEALSLPGRGGRQGLLPLFAAGRRQFPQAVRDSRQLGELLDRALGELEGRPLGYELQLKALTLEILTFLLRESSPEPQGPPRRRDDAAGEHLREILAYLAAHCTQPELTSLPALSRAFGLSVPYLCRLFKSGTNLTLTGYVNELRCQQAASLLGDGAPLEEAAAACGFADYNYFSRLFKKVMGAPPSAFRARLRQGP